MTTSHGNIVGIAPNHAVFNIIKGTTVTLTATHNGCTTTTVLPASICGGCVIPQLAGIPSQTICQGDTLDPVGSSITNGVNARFQWFNDNGAANPTTDSLSGQNTPILTALPTTPGVYKYKLVAISTTDASCVGTQTVTITINQTATAPTIGFAASRRVVCPDSSVTLTASGCATTVNWHYTRANGSTGTLAATEASVTIAYNTIAGTPTDSLTFRATCAGTCAATLYSNALLVVKKALCDTVAVVSDSACYVYIKATNAQGQETTSLPRLSGALQPLKLQADDLDSSGFWNTGVTYLWTRPDSTTTTTDTLVASKIGAYKLLVSKQGRTCEAYVTLNAKPCVVRDYTTASCQTVTINNPTASNQLSSLAPGDVFYAADYSIHVTEASGGAGGWSGKGYVEVLLPLGVTSTVAITFSGIAINDCYELTNGTVETEYDANKQLLDVDAFLDTFKEVQEQLTDLLKHYKGTPEEKQKLRTLSQQTCLTLSFAPVSNGLALQERQSQCNQVKQQAEDLASCEVLDTVSSVPVNQTIAFARQAATTSSCSVQGVIDANNALVDSVANMGLNIASDSLAIPSLDEKSGKLTKATNFYTPDEKIIRLEANATLTFPAVNSSYWSDGNVLSFKENGKSYVVKGFSGDTRLPLTEVVNGSWGGVLPKAGITSRPVEFSHLTYERIENEAGKCQIKVQEAVLQANGAITLKPNGSTTFLKPFTCWDLESLAQSIQTNISKGDGQSVVYVGDCESGVYYEVTSAGKTQLTQAQAQANYNSSSKDVAVMGCWDGTQWSLQHKFRPGALQLNPKWTKPTNKFGKPRTPVTASQLQQASDARINKKKSSLGNVYAPATGIDNHGFRYRKLDLFTYVVQFKEFTKKLVNEAKVSERVWNKGDAGYESSIINDPLGAPSGGIDAAIEEATDMVQLGILILDVVEDPSIGKQIYESISNVSLGSILDAFGEHLEIYSDPYRRGYQAGRDLFAIGSIIKGGAITSTIAKATATKAALIAAYRNVSDWAKKLDAAKLAKIKNLDEWTDEALKKLDDDFKNPNFESAISQKPELTKVWEAMISSQTLRISVENLEYVSNYILKFPNNLNDVKISFESLVEKRRVAFVKGLKNAAKDPIQITNPSKLRQANPNEIKNSVNKFADHRASVGGGGNYGYIEGSVNGSYVDDKMWRSVPIEVAENEIHIFTAIPVQGAHGTEWLRITDSEYRMLNQLAHDLGAQAGKTYPNVTGTLKIASELPYCPSCQGVIQQFHNMFPSVNLILVDGIK